jgi:hypothetical protein
MATCPNCGRFLDKHHHCAGMWRLRLRVWQATLFGGFIDGLAGFLVPSLVYGQASWLAIAIAAIIGLLVMNNEANR